MAGHSKFANTKYRKESQNLKKNKEFLRFTRNIIVAAKSGSESSLRNAVALARHHDVPKSNIDKAIKVALGGKSDSEYCKIRYDIKAPNGAFIILEILTDNKNRSASDIRAILRKNNSTMQVTGDLDYLFDNRGIIKYSAGSDVSDTAIEAGALDIEIDKDFILVLTSIENHKAISSILEEKFGNPIYTEIVWRAKNPISLSGENQESYEKLIVSLEDYQDTDKIYSNVVKN